MSELSPEEPAGRKQCGKTTYRRQHFQGILVRPLHTVECLTIWMVFFSIERGVLDFVPVTTTQDHANRPAESEKDRSDTPQQTRGLLLSCGHYLEGHPKVRKEDCSEQRQEDEAEVGSNLNGNHVCNTALKSKGTGTKVQ